MKIVDRGDKYTQFKGHNIILDIFRENESPSAQIGKTEVASPISDAHTLALVYI